MSKEVVTAVKINETYLHIDCSRSVAYELIDYFSFYVDGYRFMPAYKNRTWDGKIRLFNSNGTLYIGLLKHLAYFCRDRGYHLDFDRSMFPQVDTDEAVKYIESLTYCNDKGEEIRPRDYQMLAFKECIKRGRRTILSSTNSGKSLMIYMVARYLLHFKQISGKILVVVPTTSLVRQMAGDFQDYATKDPWNPEGDIHQIMAGTAKEAPDCQIYVSTWQSIYKQPRHYFQQFDCIIGDEVHEFEAKSTKNIMEAAISTPYRFGFTGTLREAKTNKLVIEGLFGPSIQVMTNAESIRRGESANIEIRMNVLRWAEKYQKEASGLKYNEEMEWLRNHPRRNMFIVGSVLSRDFKENSLVLVNNLDQAKALKDMLVRHDKKGRTIRLVTGSTGVDDREEVRNLINKSHKNDPGTIVVATFGVYQRGINIKHIHHLFFGSPSKSLVRVLQSIGRGLRVSEMKKSLVLWDIVDDLAGKKKTKNFSWKHAHNRLSIYEKEKFPVTHKNFKV